MVISKEEVIFLELKRKFGNKVINYILFPKPFLDKNKNQMQYTGAITVMADFRPFNKAIGSKVARSVQSKIEDEYENSISEQCITTLPFNLVTSYDYIFFKVKNLRFDSPGMYKVKHKDNQGVFIASNNMKIIN